MNKLTLLLLTGMSVFLLGLLAITLIFTPRAVSPILDSDTNGNIHSNAFVDTLQIEILETFPVQVNALLQGNLATPCSKLNPAVTNLVDNTFVIELSATQPSENACIQVLSPFNLTVPLQVEGLPKGEYVVQSQTKEARFMLEADNFIAQDLFNDDRERISLQTIGEVEAQGEATRLFVSDTFTHTVSTTLSEPQDGKFYEGWLVRPEPSFDFISTGKLTLNEYDEYALSYETDRDLREYVEVVITEETLANGLDNKPELHLLEGRF
jgi:hypothetical protein